MDEAVVNSVIERCTELTREECEHFLSKGYVVIRNAFSREIADQVVDQAWRSLAEDADIHRDQPDSWKKMPYVRPAGSSRKIALNEEAPRALRAQLDLMGGACRIKGGDQLNWGDGTVANLCKDGDQPWVAPHAEMDGWHFDGWDFYHYLDSPEQGLLVVPLFSDILPRSGGTTIATDSVKVLARFLVQHPEGVHPDGTQGGGYLIPALIEQCTEFEELIGNAGDLVLLHPLTLHRASANPSGRPRFIQNARLSLQEPMNFNRPNPADYSLVELCVLRALGAAERLTEWCPAGPRENGGSDTQWGRVPPRRFRTEREKVEQEARLAVEQRKLAAQGYYTPKWALKSYMDISGAGAHPNDLPGGTASTSKTAFLGRQESEKVAAQPRPQSASSGTASKL